jgi:hypothetical protein
MRTKSIAALVLAFALLAGAATSSVAAPITFNFTYAGGGATATGFITFESTLLANPGTNDFTLPNPAVLALQVKVSDATAGNGTYRIEAFGRVVFDTKGATLNLSQNLVGQSTSGGPWGTPSGCCGDFNLFPQLIGAPRGVSFFTLGANQGVANLMTLSQMTPASIAAVPTLDAWKLAVLVLLVGGAGITLVRRI